MENASKALLIAGTLLITLAVISIIMVFFNRGRGFTQTQVDDFEQKKIAYHNSQFNTFERELDKSELNKLINVVKKSNKNITRKEYEVSIVYNAVEYYYDSTAEKMLKGENDIEDIKHDSLDQFICSTVTNSYGIINQIIINKK